MSKFGILVCALCFVFCPLGIGMFIVNMIIHFDFGDVMLIVSNVALCYLWFYGLNESIQLKSKIKDLTNELDNLKNKVKNYE